MLLALLRSTHPGPAVTVTVVAVLLGIGVGLEPWRVVVLGLAIAFDQISVGLSNDWIDADRDRTAGRPDKPVALGRVSIPVVRTTAFLAASLAILVTIPLGWWAFLVHVIGLGSAWSYNAVLKSTPLSPLPYAVSFGLLPAFATLARAEPALPAWWATAAGALLGIAAHIANVLRDLDDDRRTGIRGLPHRLPPWLSLCLAWCALLGAAVVLALGIGLDRPIALIGILASVVVAIAGVALSFRRGSRWGFRLVLIAALVDVVLLVAAGASLVAG